MNASEVAVHDLYQELDVPPPSVAWPIAPLKPLLSRMPIRCIEISALNCLSAQKYLFGCGALITPLFPEDDEQQREPLAGFAYQGGECAFLFVNSDDPVVRRRFSMAHELGHYILHFRPVLLRWREALAAGEEIAPHLFDAFTHKEIDKVETSGDAPNYTEREREADVFAAALLMPPTVVASRAAALNHEFLSDRIGLEERLAMEFLVSRAAMRRRLSAPEMEYPIP